MFKEFYYLYNDEQQLYSAMPSGGELDSDKIRQKVYKEITIAETTDDLGISAHNIAQGVEVVFHSSCDFAKLLIPFSNKIKSIDLGSLSIPVTSLNELVPAAPLLEVLKLIGCSFSGDTPLSLPAGCMTKIRNLFLNGSTITASQLNQLLLASPNMELLTLTHCKNLGTDTLSSLAPGCLSKLTHLVLENCSITAVQFKQLLLAAPNLVTILLPDCEYPA